MDNSNENFKRQNSFKLNNSLNNINNGLLRDVKKKHNLNSPPNENIMFNNPNDVIKGITEESPLSKEFFSNKNIEAIQKSIRYQVHNETNKIIDKQSTNELLTIMRSIFIQFNDISTNSLDFLNHILTLNKKVIDFASNQIKTQVTQYDGYLNKLSQLPIPIDRSKPPETKNYTYQFDNLI